MRRGDVAASAFALAGFDWPERPRDARPAARGPRPGRSAPAHQRRLRRAARGHLGIGRLRVVGRHRVRRSGSQRGGGDGAHDGPGLRRARRRERHRRARHLGVRAHARGGRAGHGARGCVLRGARRERPRRPLRGDHAPRRQAGRRAGTARARGGRERRRGGLPAPGGAGAVARRRGARRRAAAAHDRHLLRARDRRAACTWQGRPPWTTRLRCASRATPRWRGSCPCASAP